MGDLLELAARVEALEGPDREVDAEICVALGIEPQAREMLQFAAYDRCVRYFTASLDAAMTLVPEGCWAEGSLSSPSALEIHAPMTFDPIGKGWATTPALALTAASLRARAQASGGAGDV